MATFGERLKALREQRGLTQTDLAKMVDTTPQSISNYEKDKRQPDFETLTFLCDYFNVSSDYILGKSNITMRFLDSEELAIIDDLRNGKILPNIRQLTTHFFPVLGEIACGEPKFMDEQMELYIEAGADIKADYILFAKGDSMKGARINDGDIVFIRNQPTVENGEIAAIAIDDEVTLKRFYKYEDLIVLRAENPEYKDMEFKESDGKTVRVLGKAIAFQSDVK